MAEPKKSNKEKVKEIVSSIETGIQQLFQSEKFAEYLRTMSRFHNYSASNTLLIHMQRPDASHVAGYNAWKNKFGRHVKKGEKGITILAPAPFKKKIEEMKLDPDTKAPLLDEKGNAVFEEKVVEIPMFRPVKVFDISQTDGEPLPSLVSDLTGDVQHYEAFMEALRRSSPVPVSIKPIDDSMDGFFSNTTQSITIREGMSQVQTVCAAIHEITHAKLHNREQSRLTADAGATGRPPPQKKDKNTMEVEAEAVAFSVCSFWNIDTSSNSLGYIAGWSKDKTLPELKASLETISKTADELISDIDRHFTAVCKELGMDLTAQPTALDEYPLPDAVHAKNLADSGYTEDDMLTLSKDRAEELLEKDFTVYAAANGSVEMVFDSDELNEYPLNTIFAVSREEWEASQDFHQAIAERLDHQEEREQAFLNYKGDCFAIYQLKDGDEQRNLHYMGLEYLHKQGFAADRANYDLVYTAVLPEAPSVDAALDKLWEQFNLHHPADYHRPSMSVSDIIAVKQDDVVSCHYCDRIGFTEVCGFIRTENDLKNKKEQPDGEMKKSVVSRLKSQPKNRKQTNQKANKTRRNMER